ncbi:IS110 family transposase [Reticulibacter mediterranei]|uniref:IS110 family transposase n=1 Tax=Reticulibacter mediterranei TaxID=2778369 RepID=A0A8J3N6V9_9CHLR|nr:IS110 family transposase [Reticulibacter mediterranei]GHP00540.1 IS110 family transposase [Reticulibacter mediterranei]
MQKPSTPVSYHLFVGIDIASETFTIARLLPETKPKGELKPFEQTSAGFARFRTLLLTQGIAPANTLVVMEATGSYWIGLAIFLTEAGFAVSVVNPATAHYFAKAQLKHAKNDMLDACTLAQLAQALLPACWTPPPQIYHDLQQRLTQRASLLELRTQVTNQLHALSVHPNVVPSVRQRLLQLLELLNQQVAQVEAEIHQLVKIEPPPQKPCSLERKPADESEDVKTVEWKWKQSIVLLQTIPGIGIWSACWLTTATLNFTPCTTAEALVQYAGLAPLERTSGTSVRGRALLRHHGHARIRTMLYLATLSATRYNPAIKTLIVLACLGFTPKRCANGSSRMPCPFPLIREMLASSV